MAGSSVPPAMQKLQSAVETTMDELQRTSLIPLQKQAFVCSAACCDKHAGNMQHLQNCTVQCQQKVQAAHQVMYGSLEQFQERFKRCLMRCEDKIREGLPSSPADKDIAKAQDAQVVCFDECAREYAALVPKLRADVQAALKKLG